VRLTPGAQGAHPSIVVRRPADVGIAGAAIARQFADALARASAERHDVLLATIDHGVGADGAPYAVVEWCPGEPLSRMLARERALAQRTALALFADVARGLAELQRRMPCSRRVDPRALWIASGPRGLVARVIDAGLAVVPVALPDEERVTVPGETPESCSYLSPEEARGEPFDPARAVVWGLGVLLHRMLLGALPFVARSRAQLAKLASRGSRSPRSLDPSLDLAVSDLVCACLARKPAFRPPCDVLAARAEAILGRLPITAADQLLLDRAQAAAQASGEPERVAMDLWLDIEVDESSCRAGELSEPALEPCDEADLRRDSEPPTVRLAPPTSSQSFALGLSPADGASTDSMAPSPSAPELRRKAFTRSAAWTTIAVAAVSALVAIGASTRAPMRLDAQAAGLDSRVAAALATPPSAPVAHAAPAATSNDDAPVASSTREPAPAAPVGLAPALHDDPIAPAAVASAAPSASVVAAASIDSVAAVAAVAPVAPVASVGGAGSARKSGRAALDDAWSAAPTASAPIAPAAATPGEPSVASAGDSRAPSE
jgi:serine/threonine-protein kinase